MKSPLHDKKRKRPVDEELTSSSILPVDCELASVEQEAEIGSIKRLKTLEPPTASFITSSPMKPQSKSRRKKLTGCSYLIVPKSPQITQKQNQTEPTLPRRPTSRNLALDFGIPETPETKRKRLEESEGDYASDTSSQDSTPSSSPQRKKNAPIFSPLFHLHKEKSGVSDHPKDEIEESEDSQPLLPTTLSTKETLSDLSSEPEKEKTESLYDPYHIVEDETEDVEEYEEIEEFDPYLFISRLPAAPPPPLPPVALPPKDSSSPPVTLVLDLDETLVHCSTEPLASSQLQFEVQFNGTAYQIYVKIRPHLEEFLEAVSSKFEMVIFTASQAVYASTLLDILDSKKRIKHRVYRDSCVMFDGNYLKDLRVLGRDLSQVMIVDNSPQAFGFQLTNGIPIESWFDDPDDKELLNLLPFLDELAEASDVRPLIDKKFKLREKVAQYNEE